MSKKAATTARDLELLVFAWQSLKTSPQVDYDLFAKKAGYKNAATASAQFSTLKRKVFALAGEGNHSSSSSASHTSTPSSTPRKRRGTGGASGTPAKNKKMTDYYPDNGKDDSDDDGDKSPCKKVKTELGMIANKAKREDEDEDPFRDDDDDKAIGRQLDGSYDDHLLDSEI